MAALNIEEGQVAHERQRGERRILMLALLGGFPLFLLAWCAVPGAGPILRTYSIPSTSMAPALPLHSFAVVSRLRYGFSRHSFDWVTLPIQGRWFGADPRRGDIAVFRLPRDPKVHFVKRIIGLPGDRIQITNGRLVINGVAVHRQARGTIPYALTGARTRQIPVYEERLPEETAYTVWETEGDTGPLDNTAVFVVPPGRLFYLGDNRDNSTDSRATWAVGFVPVEMLIGRVERVFGGTLDFSVAK